jgi:hypothetical protein
MSRFGSKTLLIVGLGLVLLGAVLPFLMVMRIIPASFALSFLSYGASVIGLFLGLIWAAMYAGKHRRQNPEGRD